MGDGRLPLPTRELRARLDRVFRAHAWLAEEVARISYRPPSDPREVADVMTGLDRHLAELQEASSDALSHVSLIASLAGEDMAREKAERDAEWEKGR